MTTGNTLLGKTFKHRLESLVLLLLLLLLKKYLQTLKTFPISHVIKEVIRVCENIN